MFKKFGQAIRNVYRGQKGITGLETAIILIAFVTVAAVLAYTVLSAGIFSSERGKEAVYSGLNSAGSTMGVKGSVLGTGWNSTTPTLEFTLSSAIQGANIDLTKLTFNYYDGHVVHSGNAAVGTFTFKTNGAVVTTLSGTAQVLVDVSLAAITQLTAYETFTLEIIPPTGATITIQKTLPGVISGLINFN